MKYRITDDSVQEEAKAQGVWTREEAKPLPAMGRRGARTAKFYTLPPLRSARGWSLSQLTRSLPYCLTHYPADIADALQAHVLRSQSDANLLHAAQRSALGHADPLDDLARTLHHKAYDWMQVQDEMFRGRHLFTFAQCGAKAVRALCQRNVQSAINPDPMGVHAVSPLLVPALMGGMTFTTFEREAFKVLDEVLKVPYSLPPENRRSYLRDSTMICGFGAHLKHTPNENISPLEPFHRRVGEKDLAFISRLHKTHLKPVPKAHEENGLNETQRFLLKLTGDASYAASIMEFGAYQGELGTFIADMKEDVCRTAAIALCLEGGDITRPSALRMEAGLEGRGVKFCDRTQMTEAVWAQAVRMVFMRQWKDLNLAAVPAGIEISHDTVKVVARLIISKMAKRLRMGAVAPKLPGQLVVAMSLLSGVPIVAFLRFVELDFYRRGECIMSPEGVADIQYVLDVSDDVVEHGDPDDLKFLRKVLDDYADKFKVFCGESGKRFIEPETVEQYEAGRLFARQLRSSKAPLWNYPLNGEGNSYHYVGEKAVPSRAYKGLSAEDARDMRGLLSGAKYKREINEAFKRLVDPYANTPFHTNAWKVQP